LAKEGLSILLISRSEQKLAEQQNSIKLSFGVETRYIPFDFTKTGAEKASFLAKLEEELKELHRDGGIGLLINNVGTANEHPKAFDEFTAQENEDIIHCNVFSCVDMTFAVMKYMKERRSGCIVAISSGSGNLSCPYLALYSATK
jgi:short-subunit dehydrogenase